MGISGIVMAASSFAFDWISIVYIVIVVLGLIIGIKSGFLNAFGGLIVLVIAIVAGLFLAKYVGGWIENLQGGVPKDWAIKNIQAQISGAADAVTTPLTYDEVQANMGNILNSAKIPQFFQSQLGDAILKLMAASGKTEFSGTDVCGFIAEALANFGFIAVGFLAIFLLVVIFLSIIFHALKKRAKDSKAVGALNRTLGAICGLAVAVLIVISASYGMSFLVTLNIGSVNSVLTDTMKLSDDSVWTISKFVYQNNFLQQIISAFTK